MSVFWGSPPSRNDNLSSSILNIVGLLFIISLISSQIQFIKGLSFQVVEVSICEIIEKIYMSISVSVPSSWHRAPKVLIIS